MRQYQEPEKARAASSSILSSKSVMLHCFKIEVQRVGIVTARRVNNFSHTVSLKDVLADDWP